MCKCLKEFEADKKRFVTENAAAYEEAKATHIGCGFGPMRWVAPPKSAPSICERRCPEVLLLL